MNFLACFQVKKYINFYLVIVTVTLTAMSRNEI